MLDAVIKEVNEELDRLSDTDLRSFYFDRRVDELKQEFNQYIDFERLDLLRDIQRKIEERKDSMTNPEFITYLFNLYELFINETWKLLGERPNESKYRNI